MRPKIIRMVLKDGVARASVKKKQFVPNVPPPGAPTFTIDTPIPVSVYFASVDNYVLTIDPSDDILSNTYVTFVNGTGNFTQTDVYANVYLDGVPVPGYQDIKLNKSTSTDIDVRNSGLLQDQYQLKYYARHLNTNAVPELTGEKSIETTSSNELYTLAELPPGITGAPGLMDPVPIIGAGASVATVLSITSDPGNPVFDASYCLNGNFTYLQAGPGTPPFTVTLQLDKPYVVTRYKIWPRGSTSYPDAPTDYTFRGSTDGVSWDVIDTQVNNPPPSYDVSNSVIVDDSYGHLDLPIPSPGAYTYYQLHATRTTGPNRNDQYLNIGELQLIGYEPFPILDVAAVLGAPQSTVIGEAQDTINPIPGSSKCAIRTEFSLASAGAAGVIYEAGGTAFGLAFYLFNNLIYANAGAGGSVGDLPDRYEISAPISVGVHEAIFTVSNTSGAQLYLDGVLAASSPAKAGVNKLSGGDPAGTGRFYGSMTANYALFASYGNGSSDDISVMKTEIWTSHYPGPGMSLLPVIDTSVESRFILPACGFSSGNWTGSYPYLDGITSVPVEPIGPGGPFDDLRSTIGFYTSPSYLPQDLDPVAHPGPGQALISYDKTLTKTVDVQNIGTYYVRITSRLENNFAGFDGLGPVRTDDFQLDALVPVITSPLLTAAIMDINPEYSLEFSLPNLSVQLPSTWQWTDGTGTFEAGQEELEVLFYKVSSFGQLPNFGDLAGQISGFYNGTGQSYKGDASDAGLTVQGYYRIGTRIRHRNVTLGVDGGWSNIIVDDDTYVHTLGPTITAVNQQARDNDNEGILIASGTTFDFVDGDYAPVDIDISTGRLVFLQFEIHSDPGFTSKLFSGQMAVLGQNVATGVGTFYVRYKLSYVHVDDSGSTSAPSAWFPDPAGAITVVEPVITAPTITNFPDLDFSNFNNADSVPSLNVSASWSWTDGTGIFTNDEEELEMLFYKVPYEDQSPNEYPILGSDPADLNSPDATVSGLLYSSSGYDGVLAQAGLTVQGLYRVGFRIRHRHISSGRTGDWSSIELLSQTLYYTLDPVINSVSSGAYVDVNHKLVLPALLDFVNSIGNYNPSDPEVDLHNFYYTEYEVHGNASFTDLKLQGEVTGTVSLDTDGGYNYIRYRTFIKNIVFLTNPTWGYLYVNSKYSAWVSDTSNPVMVPYAFDSASLSPVTRTFVEPSPG